MVKFLYIQEMGCLLSTPETSIKWKSKFWTFLSVYSLNSGLFQKNYYLGDYFENEFEILIIYS